MRRSKRWMLGAAVAVMAGTTAWASAAGIAAASIGHRDAAFVRDASSAYGNGHTTPTEPPASLGPATHDPRDSAHHSNGLPFTGSDVLGLTFVGIGLVLMGTALPGSPRHRRRARDVPADT